MMKILFISFFVILNVLTPGQQREGMIKHYILSEFRRHPEMRVEDLYKFIHQASFGSEHAVKDTAGVINWMKNEISGLDYSIEDSLIDTLSPGIVRINLRPYLRKNLKSDDLVFAFIKTANSYKGSEDLFQQYWKTAEALSADGMINIPVSTLANFYTLMSKKGLPAIHHSDFYEEKYKPAYRVIDIRLLDLLFSQ